MGVQLCQNDMFGYAYTRNTPVRLWGHDFSRTQCYYSMGSWQRGLN